jgi:hypothetical protein
MRGQDEHVATLTDDGAVVLADGRRAGTLSAAEQLVTGRARNGWLAWHAERHGERVRLDGLRDAFYA